MVESDTSSHTISVDGRHARRKQISSALKSKKRREAFVRQQIEIGLPFQIKAMRKREKWNQLELGQKLGKPQSVISRLESPGYGRFTISTLIEIAAAFDVALQVSFVPFSSLVNRAAGFSIDDISPASFDKDVGLHDRLTSGTGNVILLPTVRATAPVNFLGIRSDVSSDNPQLKVAHA